MIFQQQYISLREKEQRLYSDGQVLQLPLISNTHPHYAEWQMRKQSSERLIKHLCKMKRPLSILEIGCGNGWLCSKLATIPNSHVTGFDINTTELEQASRVFYQQSNLDFVSENPFLLTHLQKSYDVIVFAAAIQYFPSIDKIITDALRHLTDQGCIHIIDTHFYRDEEVAAAQQRTAAHYELLGLASMSAHYFHHTVTALKQFNTQTLYNPNSLWNKLRKNNSPFPWICIKQQ